MKILRLSPTDARTWRENRSILVDQNGDHVRPIEIAETRALSELQKRSRHLKQPLDMEIKQTTRSGEVTTKLAISFRQIDSKNTMMVSCIDGYEVIEGREFFQNQVLKVHGECQLRTHTGQFMRAVRDPNTRRSTAKESQRRGPSPAHCHCMGWGEPHAGRHHSVCEWNVTAPEDERAFADETSVQQLPGAPTVDHRVIRDMRPVEKPSILQQPKPRANAAESMAAVTAAVAAAIPNIPSPDACTCKDFAMPHTGERRPDGVHHPICQHKEAWEALHLPKMVLVSLSTGKVSRRATADEMRQASGDKGYITIGDEQFGVIPEAEAFGKVNVKKDVPPSTAAAE